MSKIFAFLQQRILERRRALIQLFCRECNISLDKNNVYQFRNTKHGKNICKNCINSYNREFYNNKRKSILVKMRQKSLEWKKIALSKIGTVCCCCGFSDIRFLSIDHINPVCGKRKFGSGYKFYRAICEDKENISNLQTLCYNCNFAKRMYPVCPHKMNSKTELIEVLPLREYEVNCN